jgi:hypothetical protein
LRARLKLRQHRQGEAVDALVSGLGALRTQVFLSAWVDLDGLLAEVAASLRGNAALSEKLYAALDRPFPVLAAELARQSARLDLAMFADRDRLCVEAWKVFEPFVPWTEPALQARADCYRRAASPLAPLAAAELQAFRAEELAPLVPVEESTPAP